MAYVRPGSQDTPSWTYTWLSAADTLRFTPKTKFGDTLKGIGEGSYTLHIQSPDGCDTMLTFEIEDAVTLTVDPTDTILRYGDTIQLTVSGMEQYIWSPSTSLSNDTAANPDAWPPRDRIYTVSGQTASGCSGEATVSITIDYTLHDFVPNAFSPNGDGINDIFRVENVTYQDALEFRIFNRYGQCIFHTVDARQGWDGSDKGMPADLGTYYYYIRLGYPDGKRKILKGEVILLR